MEGGWEGGASVGREDAVRGGEVYVRGGRRKEGRIKLRV